jgi:hypothetical protein
MTRKQLPYFVAFLVLMFGAMACACLGSGTGIGGFQATANAAFTQAAAGAATVGAVSGTAGAQGNSANATASAISGGNGGGEASATPGAAGSTARGGPSDIPLVSGQNNVLFATGQLVTYQTKTDIAAVATFYKDAMPKNEWTQDTTASVQTPTATVLSFKKGTRTAVVTISKDPNSGETLVAIVVQ